LDGTKQFDRSVHRSDSGSVVNDSFVDHYFQ
jgi:hypothetical protein